MRNVFLVDDDVFVRKGIQTLVKWEEFGFQVCGEADNGEDALEQILEIQPDLVLTDIRMPVLDGLTLIERVIEQMDNPPSFIVISGYNDFKYAQKALRFGVQDFLLKPVDQEELYETLDRVAKNITFKHESIGNIQKIEAVSIVRNYLTDEPELDLVSEAEHPIMDANEYTFLKVEVNGFDLDYPHIEAEIENQLEEYHSVEKIVFYEDGIGYYCVVLTDHFLDSNKLTLEKFINQFQKQLAMRIQLPIKIYEGKTVATLDELNESYRFARNSIQYKYLLSNVDVIRPSMVKDMQVYYIDLDQEVYDRMIEYMEENDLEMLEKQVQTMLSLGVEKQFAKDAFKTVVNRFNHEVLTLLKEVDGYESKLEHFNTMLEWDRYPITLKQLEEIWFRFLSECSNILIELNQNHVKGTIYQIKKYIHSHFHQQITMKSIANKFYINPVYMGQLFKKTYGIYFKDYVLQVRIQEAKRLLRQTDMRIYEVAEKVGFNNPDYFVTQFEKIVGKTPSQYRKQLTNQIG